MAGPPKNRQARDRQQKHKESSSKDKQSSSSPSENSPTSLPSQPPNFDGNRDPATPRARAGNQPAGQVVAVLNRNIDIGALGASHMNGFGDIPDLPLRPVQLSRSGREVNVKLNTFHVVAYPSKPVYQYDIVVGNGQEKRGLIRRVWGSKTMQKELGPGWIYDGNKIAWSMTKPNGQKTVHIDLDEERGQTVKEGKKSDIVQVVVTYAKQVDFASLRGYLDRSLKSMNEDVLEAINFLDHLMRETPSQKLTTIKRNFFAKGQVRTPLGSGIEAFKGVYASIRMVNHGPGAGAGLSVNVDVANTAFWTAQDLPKAAAAQLGARDMNHLSQMLGAGGQQRSPAMIGLRKLRRVFVYTTHREPAEKAKESPFCIDSFVNQTARQYKFKEKTDKGEREVTIEQYMKHKYNITLQYPNLPLVQMTKASVVLPMELCILKENQRFVGKLSDVQTQQMIKVAVTLPEERWASIERGKALLDWGNDKFLANYGLQISPTPTAVKGRLLPNPKVGFQNKQEDPRTSGRWDLRGKMFSGPHTTPLKAWGVSVMPGRGSASKEQVENFIQTFMNVFSGHGGKIANKNPVIIQGTEQPNKDVETLWTAVGNANKMNPQLLVFIVPDKNAERYTRIKRSCDCRYGVVSQVLWSGHIQKNQPQYSSNVAMKVNAKLGGMTAKAMGTTKPFTKPTMIIGADVSHAAPGAPGASVAAITVSWDREAIRYAAAVQTNGSRVEMITKENITSMLEPLVKRWMQTVGNGAAPVHVMYFRDGVSEGQYAHVLNQEVRDLRAMFQAIDPKAAQELTVIVASKRHHIRFFPDRASADRNGNPQPGTLIETGVTHPFEYDFYLNSHSAIKGTARPIHYHVLKDEAKLGVDQLQNMIYEASYQYVRSTTPVSMFPAVYYAHLAAARATAHIDPANYAASEATGASPKDEIEIKPLTAMNNQNGIRGVMWYI